MEKMKLPQSVERALAMLNGAGYEGWLVGGAVRDFLLGIPAHDFDITTNALPEQIKAVFWGYRLIETGLKHGTVTVLMDGEPLEITTYRVDGAYTDHRRPDSVSFTPDLREDLERRDFTVNALAYHPEKGVVDLVGGMEDIRDRRIRCVGDPDRRFREDALRILRALRFASVYGMTIEESTAAAIHRNANLLSAIAAERVREEFTRLLCGKGVEDILLGYHDVFRVVIPELGPMAGFDQHNIHHDRDVWAHTAAVVAGAGDDPILSWAALLHDVGKPPCFTLGEDGVGHFYGHGEKSTAMAGEILTRLRFDNAGREELLKLIRYHDLPIPPERKPVRRLVGKLGADTTRRLIRLHMADTLGQSPICAHRVGLYGQVEEVLDALLTEEDCFSLRQLAVNGTDMMALGLTGREIGAALDRCLTAVLEEQCPNEKNALLELVKKPEP